MTVEWRELDDQALRAALSRHVPLHRARHLTTYRHWPEEAEAIHGILAVTVVPLTTDEEEPMSDIGWYAFWPDNWAPTYNDKPVVVRGRPTGDGLYTAILLPRLTVTGNQTDVPLTTDDPDGPINLEET